MRVHGIRLTIEPLDRFEIDHPDVIPLIEVHEVTWIHGDETMTCRGVFKNDDNRDVSAEIPMDQLPTWVAVRMLEETTGEKWKGGA